MAVFFYILVQNHELHIVLFKFQSTGGIYFKPVICFCLRIIYSRMCMLDCGWMGLKNRQNNYSGYYSDIYFANLVTKLGE